MKKLELAGSWNLAPVSSFPDSVDMIDTWLEMAVPSHWQQHPDLVDYAGKVVYKKSFSFRPAKGKTYQLTLPGIFYWSTVFLNGEKLGDHEGYFSPQSYDVTRLLRTKNELVVFVNCPNEKTKNDKRMITGVFSHWDCLDPKTNPGGIWLAPTIRESEGAFIDGAQIHTESIAGGNARVRVRVNMTGQSAENATLRITYKPATFKGKAQSFDHTVTLANTEKTFDRTHELKNPHLWWTHDLGKPDMYLVEISLLGKDKKVLDRWSEQIGIRTVEVRDWIYFLNGERLYIRGNNYAPSETRIATTTAELVEKDVQLAIDCHLNLLRVHAHVDHPAFYEAADRMGLLLWQDFPLQWSYRREILPIASKQIRQMVRLLYNHPSIANWCCHNEAIYLVDTKDEDLVNLAKSAFSIFGWSWNRDVMDEELLRSVKAQDPSRFVVRSSGEPALFKKGGDTHFYFGWYRVQGPKRAFDRILKIAPKNVRFVTEFGAQSFPNLESSKRFMDKDIGKIDWENLEQRHSLQTDLMEHWVGLGHASLGELIDASQEYQSRINQYYIDRIRHRKYDPGGGVVPFMFNDPNPAIQWSIVDYWRIPKKSYFAMQRAMSPQYAFVLLDKDLYKRGKRVNIPIYIVNDSKKSFANVRVDYAITGPDGDVVAKRGFELFLPVDCKAIQVAQMHQLFAEPGDYLLTLKVTHPDFTLDNDYPISVR